MYIVGPAKFWAFFSDFAIPAGCVLVVISLLAATSNNASQRVLGKRVWGAIHTGGVYVIWGWFFKVYVLSKMPNIQTVAQKPYIFVYVGLLFSAMLLRLVMATRRVLGNRA
jgi:DMSO/TMAO reductase YedYZ heme-binding membrane subunit